MDSKDYYYSKDTKNFINIQTDEKSKDKNVSFFNIDETENSAIIDISNLQSDNDSHSVFSS